MCDVLCDGLLDLAAVQADDEFLTMLSGPVVVTDDELARVLYRWRRDVESEPSRDLVSVEVASVVIAKARRSHRVRRVLSVVRRLMGGRR